MPSHSNPKIGIPVGKIINNLGVSGYDLKEAYVSALLKQGARPFLIPVDLPVAEMESIVETFDGFLLSGGADIDPELFGGQPNERIYGISSVRDTFEISLVKTLLKINKPLLAICRGMQVLNVALGGSLYTDISTQITNAKKHDWFPSYPRDRLSHKVKIHGGTKLSHIIGLKEIRTNSLHHQSVKVLGKHLLINATAEDDVYEGIEHANHVFMVGVQWHPEWLQNEPSAVNLFSAFIGATKKGLS